MMVRRLPVVVTSLILYLVAPGELFSIATSTHDQVSNDQGQSILSVSKAAGSSPDKDGAVPDDLAPNGVDRLGGDSHGLSRIDLPVSWQMTRARLLSAGGASTHSESFRETWAFELAGGGVSTLVSPRARVPVYRFHLGEERGVLPASVVLLSRDFARLIGVERLSREAIENLQTGQEVSQVGVASPGLVTLNLGQHAKYSEEIVLTLSDSEHLAIQFEVGAPNQY